MGDSRLWRSPEGLQWAKVGLKLQKVAKMFGGFAGIAYLCPVGSNPPAPQIMEITDNRITNGTSGEVQGEYQVPEVPDVYSRAGRTAAALQLTLPFEPNK